MSGAQSSPTGTLYIVGTPIGNLDDLSARARRVLCDVSVVAAEDTRRTRGLLSSIGSKAALIACHEHNESARSAELVERLRSGTDIALVSDAGMPLISDPGFRIVNGALEAGVAVCCIPGPSAVLTALVVSGLPTDRFVFEGFLARRAAQRDERLRRLAGEARTMVFFESVHRIEGTLAALVEHLGGERRAVICRELTKLHESVYRDTLAALHAALGKTIPLRGEFVVVVAGSAPDAAPGDEELRRVFALLCGDLAPGRAAALTAAITGASRNAVYALTRTGRS